MQFDVVFMMTEGGPGDATMLLSILLYRKTFLFSDFGGGAAVSNLLAFLCLGLGLLFVRMLYRPEAEIQHMTEAEMKDRRPIARRRQPAHAGAIRLAQGGAVRVRPGLRLLDPVSRSTG